MDLLEIYASYRYKQYSYCPYLQLLSRGSLTVPSLPLKDFTCGCFAVLDNLSNLTTKKVLMSKTYQALFYQNTFQQFVLLVIYTKNGVLTLLLKS